MPVTYTTHIYFVDCIIDYMYFYQLKTIPVAFRLPLSLFTSTCLSLSLLVLAVVRQEAVQCFFYCAVICSHIDDLVLSAPARAKRAELTVTSPPLPPRFPLCVTFPSCLRSVCLREAEMSSEIGWDAVNVGQELPVPTGLLSGSPNLPKNVPSLFRSSAATEGLVLGHVVHASFLSLGFI